MPRICPAKIGRRRRHEAYLPDRKRECSRSVCRRFRRTASRHPGKFRSAGPVPGVNLSEAESSGGMRPYGRSGTACPGRYLPDFGQRHTNRGSSGKPRFRQRHCRAHSRERLAERLARPLVPPGGVLPAANVYGREADRFPAGSAADRRGTSGHGRGTALTCLGTIRFGIRSFGTAARATPPGRGFRMQLYQPHVCDRTRVARRKGPAAAVDRPVDL